MENIVKVKNKINQFDKQKIMKTFNYFRQFGWKLCTCLKGLNSLYRNIYNFEPNYFSIIGVTDILLFSQRFEIIQCNFAYCSPPPPSTKKT